VVLPGATVIGRVSIGSRSSVWYGCVIRADEENIRIGADSNIQDCAVLHADPGFPVAIGDRVTVGHGAIVHGSFVDHDSLVGMGAVLLNGCHIGSNSIVAAGSVVREGAAIPAGCLVAGTPGVVKRDLAAAEIAQIQNSWNGYVQRARRHRESLYGTIRAPE
jgi:carbonic anhydrase/acetyltransferase-like protein (isoleucine patch superfamily)